MSLKITCRHCKKPMGEIKDDTEIKELLNDLSALNETEGSIHQQEDGTRSLELVCENCEEILNENPTLFELDYFIH
ncbi:hypothetical protein CEY16_12320 [Halalkalibacillus sediminis]|uniref:DUF2757 domain-containing protein n=1 Tax=Halalkalibacillus sediminis TaxID=2018042 RepID=A0A2I0QT77_9BACI|nr:anti-sigma-F factor Fin [Halalkalibacillus sediminis]PKR77504.1 hypothetical protein CEY16_12320 [Halalkalibacillus sediminis]